MDGKYIMVDGVRYKRMVDERKQYRYPITDEKRLTRKLNMREYRKKIARMKWICFSLLNMLSMKKPVI